MPSTQGIARRDPEAEFTIWVAKPTDIGDSSFFELRPTVSAVTFDFEHLKFRNPIACVLWDGDDWAVDVDKIRWHSFPRQRCGALVLSHRMGVAGATLGLQLRLHNDGSGARSADARTFPRRDRVPAVGAGAPCRTRTERSHTRCPSKTGNNAAG